MTAIQSDIEETLAAAEPDVEVLLAEVLAGPAHPTLRIFIDHPDGVTLALCERVTHALSPLRERYTLEVSSPGSERPLTKPDHFRRYLGRRARVRIRQQLQSGPGRSRGGEPGPTHERAAGRRRSFTGELVGASESEVTLAAEDGIVAIPYSEIRRSNLVEE